jgi:hypothetical protein
MMGSFSPEEYLEEKLPMQSATNPAKRLMFVLKLSFIVSMLLFFYVTFMVPTHVDQPITPAFELAIIIVALTADVVGFFARGLLSRMMKRAWAKRPEITPVSQWLTGNMVSLACFEACTLFGMVLHFTGAPVRLVEFLCSVGIISLVLWRPGTPPAGSDGIWLQS